MADSAACRPGILAASAERPVRVPATTTLLPVFEVSARARWCVAACTISSRVKLKLTLYARPERRFGFFMP